MCRGVLYIHVVVNVHIGPRISDTLVHVSTH